MDMITLAMAKAYSDSKGGYVEPGKVISWDGDKTGVDHWPMVNPQWYKVSDDVVDLTKLSKVMTNEGVLPLTDCFVETTLVGFHTLKSSSESGSTLEFVMVAFQEFTDGSDMHSKGTYFVENVRSIEIPETIHPIDPKFLPGVCLPVVMDCDVMGITEVLGQLLATGGGEGQAYNYGAVDYNGEFWNTPLSSPNLVIKAYVDGTTYFSPSFVNMDEDGRPFTIGADVYVRNNGMHKCFVQFIPCGSSVDGNGTQVKMIYLGTVG